MCISEFECTDGCGCLQRPEDGILFPWAGGIICCELCYMGAGNHLLCGWQVLSITQPPLKPHILILKCFFSIFSMSKDLFFVLQDHYQHLLFLSFLIKVFLLYNTFHANITYMTLSLRYALFQTTSVVFIWLFPRYTLFYVKNTLLVSTTH